MSGSTQTQEGQRNRWSVVAAAAIAVFMAQLDMTVVNVALPTIEHDFGTSTGLTEWVVLGYVLPMIAFTLPSGRWLAGVGRRTALVFSVAGFGAASVAVGLAPGVGWMIGARAVQGAFGAVLFALVPVLTTLAVRPEARGRAMALIMTVGPLGAVSGPLLGGLVIETAGWPWIFYLNVPITLLVVGIARAQLPADGGLRLPDRAWAAETGLLSGATMALMLGLSLAAEGGIGWLALTPVAVPFVLAWRRLPGSGPVRELARVPGMAGPHLALLAEMAAVMVVQFLIPFHLRGIGASPGEIGTTMLAFPAAVMAAGLVGGALADRFGPRRVSVAGAVLVTAGVLLVLPIGADLGRADLVWRLAVAGAGEGLFAGPNQNVAMAASPRHLLNITGATTSLVRQLGIALGPALATTAWALSGYSTSGMRVAVALAAVLGAVSVLSLLRRRAFASAAEGVPVPAPPAAAAVVRN